MFWNRIANQNHFLDCICCAMVAIAARQGESSRLKIRKLSAAREVGNHVCTACATVTASSWTEDGECDKEPKAFVIENGEYKEME